MPTAPRLPPIQQGQSRTESPPQQAKKSWWARVKEAIVDALKPRVGIWERAPQRTTLPWNESSPKNAKRRGRTADQHVGLDQSPPVPPMASIDYRTAFIEQGNGIPHRSVIHPVITKIDLLMQAQMAMQAQELYTPSERRALQYCNDLPANSWFETKARSTVAVSNPPPNLSPSLARDLTRDAIAGIGMHVAPGAHSPGDIIFLQGAEVRPKDGDLSAEHLQELQRHERALVTEVVKGSVRRENDGSIKLESDAAVQAVAGMMDTLDRVTGREDPNRSPMPNMLNLESRIAVNKEYVGMAKDRLPSLDPSEGSIARGITQTERHANKGVSGPDFGR
jgi:hypothetical protein